MTDRRHIIRRTALTATVMVVVGASGAVASGAGSWPQAGGDGGRSGNQALSGGPGVLRPLWSRAFAADRALQSGVVVTAPGFARAAPRVVYGTRDGRIHLRDLATGAAVGNETGTSLMASQSPDAFGGHDGALTAVDTTDADGYGQLFVVHNDDDQADLSNPDPKAEFPDDIAIAQIDTESGRVVQDVSVPGTDGFTVSAPPLLTEKDAAGRRHLVFTAVDSKDWEMTGGSPTAFSVPLLDARRASATIDVDATATTTFDSLDPRVPPTLLYLADEQAPVEPGAAPVTPEPFVAFATAEPDAPVQLRSPDLATSGPSSPRLDRDAASGRRVYASAVAVPIGEDGNLAGTSGSGAVRAPVLYVSSYDTGSRQTTVHRLVPAPDGGSLVVAASSAPIPGRGGPLMAVSQVGGGAGVASGRVVVATSSEVVALRGSDLVRSWRAEPPTGEGFANTGPTLVGDAVALQTDRGRPLVLDRDTGKPLGPGRFGPTPERDALDAARLSPAAGSGVIVFAGDRGLTVYGTTCGNRIDGTDGNDTIPGTRTGDDVHGRGGVDLMDLGDGDDCAEGGAGDDRVDAGDGDDTLDGGAGDDLLIAGAGNDRLLGGAGIDQLLAGSGDDALTGGLGDDLLKGMGGDDRLQGGDGADRMTGGDGNDRLEGDSGNDRMKGNAGDDVLVGGPGRDRMDGGAGNDIINAAVNAGSRGNEIIGGSGNDKIFAVNRVRDVVKCGSGVDSAQVDHKDVVSGCEVVVRRRAPRAKRKKARR